MKEQFMQIPAPLQRQILTRLSCTVPGAAIFFIIMAYHGDWRLLLPCLIFSVICFGAAAALFRRCALRKFVVITGTCTEIEKTSLRGRIKAIYLRSGQNTIQLMGIRKIRNLVIGDAVTVYVADNTAVYDWEGCKVICSYLALTKEDSTLHKQVPQVKAEIPCGKQVINYGIDEQDQL